MSKREERVKKVIANISQNLTELAEILLSAEPVESDQKKKRPRDPNAPKQPPSNFFLFTNSIREQVDKENPDATFVEKSKIYGARWQQLTEEEKKPFTEKAKREREKYLKEVAAYEKAHPELVQHSEKKAKTKPEAKKEVPTKVKKEENKQVLKNNKKNVNMESDSSSSSSEDESSDSDTNEIESDSESD